MKLTVTQEIFVEITFSKFYAM